MTALLAWIGARARIILPLGLIGAIFVPQLSSALRPALPFLVALVLALAMARIDMRGAARAAFKPRRLVQLGLICLALMPATALVYWGLARVLHLPGEMQVMLVYLAAAPPIASAAGLCFLLGHNARLAVEVTLASTVLTPLLGPLTVAIFLPEAAALSPTVLAVNLAWMIALGIVMALATRVIVGAERIARQAKAFDGVNALVMLVFVVPLFDGVPALVKAAPGFALAVLGLVFVANIGVNLATRAALSRRLPAADAGAVGIVQGNRTVALYLAALPPDPAFSLFVALYQFPMYLTPLIFHRKAR